MKIDMQIALGLYGDVHEAMTGELVQHMVEKTDAGGNIRHPGAIKVNGHRNIGFLGLSFHGYLTHRIAFSRYIIKASYLTESDIQRQKLDLPTVGLA